MTVTARLISYNANNSFI